MKNFIKEKYKWVQKLFENMSKDNMNEYTAQCSYYTILSFIPFVILLITLIQYTSIDQQMLFNAITRIIPASMNELVLGIVQEVYSKSIGTISISIIFTLWSAGRGLYALTKGLQSIYHIKGEKKSSYLYLRLQSIIETIIFIVLIVVGLVLLVFSSSLIEVAKVHLKIIQDYNILSQILTEVIFIILTTIIFIFVYRFMPNKKNTIKSQLPGAIFGAIVLNIVSFIFGKYLYIFKGFSITYGSLTTMMLIMMWTYACFYIIFLGAELNKMLKRA